RSPPVWVCFSAYHFKPETLPWLLILHNYMDVTQSSVLILSGWIHYSVVNEQFTRILTRLLEEGVNIYIGFGYEDSKGKHTLYPDSQKALGVLQKLQKQADKFKGKLFVGRFSNHQKILIIDQHKVVCGSNNWLSNRTFRNKEKSIVIEDPNLANEIFKEIIQLIKANPA
ncbi:MAG: hypothetical protein PWR00_1030, partial [Thermovirga sp.]|nr:hypothetical protein [Thermovirga sp.]